jgi:hypothetical protein
MRLALSTTVVLLAAMSAPAELISFRVGENGYTGGREATLREAEPNTALGTVDDFVSIDASDDGLPNHGLFAFDGIIGPGPNQIPAGAIITSATIDLTIDSAGSGMIFHRMLIDWNESTVTWNSFGSGVQADGVEARTAPSLTLGANNGDSNVSSGPLLINVTADIQAWANGETNFGWGILPIGPQGTNGIDFFTKEHAAISSRPLLMVSYVIPEPGALALLVPVLPLAARRRR